ncbi:hypothetical protein [Acrocarpospora sp. B8E8]|uniref:hypothetical protein n=1 Tax=Acrocarpospora sp. B8E8 TaxID=3153572 RepID=UPI00325C6456
MATSPMPAGSAPLPVTLHIGGSATLDLGTLDVPITFETTRHGLHADVDNDELPGRLADLLRRAADELENPEN